MPQLVTSIFLSPRTWLAIGVFCIGAAFVIGYHEDQRSAERVLHQRLGLPPEVLIQDFIGDRDKNMIGQMRILGELDKDIAVRMNLGSDQWPHWVTATPVFPVGIEMMPLAVRFMNEQNRTWPRPMPRSNADRVGHHQATLKMLERYAFAFILVNDSKEGFGSEIRTGTDVDVLEESDSRLLVRLQGAEISGRAFQDRVSATMREHGIEAGSETLLIAPVTAISAEMASSEQLGKLRRVLTIMGGVFALFAMMAPRLPRARRGKAASRPRNDEVPATSAFPAVSIFQPIATQHELSLDEPESRTSGTSGGFSCFAAISPLQQIFRFARSPR